MSQRAECAIKLEDEFGAHNYKSLPVVLTKGSGAYLWDVEGKRYIDMMGAYSAVSHGHAHPRILAALNHQAAQLAVCSRAYHTDRLGPFLKRACELTGFDKGLPMNSGAEAVETAIKAMRKWGYTVKQVAEGQAEIIVCQNNFHGRTTTIISMSTEPQYRYGFSPYTPGFKFVPFGDAKALEAAITPNTVGFLVEPIQGEAGIVMPPAGYLKACEAICRQHQVLLVADEIQTGLGRTGKLLACMHEGVQPDAVLLGKALGGGVLPVSLFLAKNALMQVFTPGDHGSTFGGNPLAAAVGLEALNVIVDEKLAENAARLGPILIKSLQALNHPAIQAVRGQGLFVGLEFKPAVISAREVCLRLMAEGVLSKETHETVVRLAPPLVITEAILTEALEKIRRVIQTI